MLAGNRVAHGHPHRLEDLDYFGGASNVSAISDKELFPIQCEAHRRFLVDARRTARILRRHPRRWILLLMDLLTLAKIVPQRRRHA